jgi:hypothetical protein
MVEVGDGITEEEVGEDIMEEVGEEITVDVGEEVDNVEGAEDIHKAHIFLNITHQVTITRYSVTMLWTHLHMIR